MKTGPESDPASTLRLISYLHGELPPAERQGFETEMASDPALAAEVAEYQNLSLELELLHAPTAPLTLGDERRERVLSGGLFLRRRRIEMALSFLAGAALVGLGLLLFRPQIVQPAVLADASLNPVVAPPDDAVRTSPPTAKKTSSAQYKKSRPSPLSAPIAANSSLQALQDQSRSLRDGVRDRYLESFYAKLELTRQHEEELKQLISQRALLLGNQRLLARGDNERHEQIQETAATLDSVNLQIDQMLGDKAPILKDYRSNISGRLIVEAMNSKLAAKQLPVLDSETSDKLSQIISSAIKNPITVPIGQEEKLKDEGVDIVEQVDKVEQGLVVDDKKEDPILEDPIIPEGNGVIEASTSIPPSTAHLSFQIQGDALLIGKSIQDLIMYDASSFLSYAQLNELRYQIQQGLPLIPGTDEVPSP